MWMQISAIAVKELKLLVRDPGGLLLLFALPALFIVVLSVSLRGTFSSNEADRLIILGVDERRGVAGTAVFDGIEATGRFTVLREVGGRNLDARTAEALVARGEHRMAVIVPEGADAAIALRRAARIDLVVDPALSLETAMAVRGVVLSVVHGATVAGVLRRGGVLGTGETASDFLARKGLAVELRNSGPGRGKVLPNSVQQNVPGWTIFALFWITQILALSIIDERTSGAFARLLVAPLSLGVYMVGKVVPFLVVNLVQAVLMFGIGVVLLPLFDCPRLEIANPIGLTALTVAISLVAIGFGLVMASLSTASFLVASVSASVLVVMTAMGGIMVPKFIMPVAMQRASWFVPHGWALEGYLDILVRGKGAIDVLPHVGVLLGFAAACFVFAAWRMARIQRQG
ncbi:MAG: ABC transporter permease [Deltaproteobacteria bacterium]|nr:ABC transporter permease [Deltaproteobacteria bacterium]